MVAQLFYGTSWMESFLCKKSIPRWESGRTETSEISFFPAGGIWWSQISSSVTTRVFAASSPHWFSGAPASCNPFVNELEEWKLSVLSANKLDLTWGAWKSSITFLLHVSDMKNLDLCILLYPLRPDWLLHHCKISSWMLCRVLLDSGADEQTLISPHPSCSQMFFH